MVYFETRKYKEKEAMQIVGNFLAQITDSVDREIKKGEGEYISEESHFYNGEKIKIMRIIPYLDFDELFHLALVANGYDIKNFEHVSNKNFQGFLLKYSLTTLDERISR